ncbi:MAG: hypothetical protein KAS07_02255, partial [Candidatus Pacebacteria bacterium]|nr:hypothetical protein [Candidatus Paceibacterota bacterium]
IFFVILWIVSRKGSKETKGYTNETPVRSETIKTARRAPLSDRMPVLHDKDKPKKSEMTIPQKEKLQEKLPDGIKRADLETEEEVKRTDENRILQEKKKDDDFHVVTAKFPRKTSLPDDVGDIPQKTAKGVSDVISGNDEERLAALWPNKYSKKDKDKKETIAYSAVSLYIKQTRRLGFKDDEIKKELLEAGWKSEDVDNGFKATT